MRFIALAVLAVMIPLSTWAWRRKPGRQAQDEFIRMWQVGPWGKQVITDFYALELMLALWMVAHAAAHGTWILVALCIAAMPVFGAMPAAVYWLAAGV